jgi:uncharacterized protein YbjT (DUF2867 family)
MAPRPILIVGGTGKTGARVTKLLHARGMATRPVSRSTAIPLDWNSQVMRCVEEALGRPPRDFSYYVRATAATGVWRA